MQYNNVVKGHQMEIYFNEKYLEQLYTEGVSDKKHRYQPQIIRKYIRIIDLMIGTTECTISFKLQFVKLRKTERE